MSSMHSIIIFVDLLAFWCGKKVQLAAQCAAAPGCVSTGRHGAVLQDSEGQAQLESMVD